MTATGDMVAAAGSLAHLPAGLPVSAYLGWSGDGTSWSTTRPTAPGRPRRRDGGVHVLTSCRRLCLAGVASDITRTAVASEGELRMSDPGGESTIPLPGLRPGAPVWSPDSTRIAFASPTGLYVVSADGTWLRRYWDPAPRLLAIPPSWSPEGDFLAYVAAKPLAGGDSDAEGLVLAEYRLIVVDVGSGSIHKIATLGRCTCEGLAPAVAWSPDGSWSRSPGWASESASTPCPRGEASSRASTVSSRWHARLAADPRLTALRPAPPRGPPR